MKRIALRQSPCGIPKVVVKVCPFVSLFFYLQCHISQENIHSVELIWIKDICQKFIQMLSVDGVKCLCHIIQQNVS